MKRAILLLAVCACFALAQGGGAPPREHTINPNPSAAVENDVAAEHEDPMLKWKWINFAILVGVLGYLIGKKAPAFFQGRTAGIQRDIREATRLREEAEQRAAEMERRMASLGDEIEKVRHGAKRQMAHEGERIRQETAQHIARVQHAAEQDISALAKHATQELKAYSAALAIDLAEQRIRTQMTGDSQNHLVERFVRDLDAKEARN
jgi:F-type H+-transporting ATPase subunit b